jgi:hypothetical protein
LLEVYGGDAFGEKAVEGTWMFLAAGFALVLVLAYRVQGFPDNEATPSVVSRRRDMALPTIWVNGLRESSAVLALLASGLIVLGLFPSFVFGSPVSYADVNEFLAYHAVLAAGLFLAGVLLLRQRTWVVGATALGVITALLVVPRGDNLIPSIGIAGTASGDWLVVVGCVIATVGAVLAVLAVIGNIEPQDQQRPAPTLLVLATAAMGFATAVGFGMHFIRAGNVSSVSIAKLFDALRPDVRPLGSGLFVITLLTVLPMCAAAIRQRAVTIGALLGLTVFVGAIGSYRLYFVYSSDFIGLFGGGTGTSVRATEGTWTFLAAGGAVLILIGYRALTMRPVRAEVPRA